MDAMEKRKDGKDMLANVIDEAVLEMFGLDIRKASEDPSIAQER
jgi:hypothetical protein